MRGVTRQILVRRSWQLPNGGNGCGTGLLASYTLSRREMEMHWIPVGVALLVAVAIIAIGLQYLASPRTAVRSFGMPLPEDGPNIDWWLRLKGVRDIASGL